MGGPLRAFAGGDAFFVFLSGQTAFRQQQSAERPQIVQNPPARCDMEIQLGQIVGHQKQRLLAAGCAIALRGRNFGLHIAPGFVQGFGEHSHILVRTLDTVKRRLGFVAHNTPFRPPTPGVVLHKLKCSLILAQIGGGGW